MQNNKHKINGELPWKHTNNSRHMNNVRKIVAISDNILSSLTTFAQ